MNLGAWLNRDERGQFTHDVMTDEQVMPDEDYYRSGAAQILRRVTATQRVVWSPENGWE